VDVVLLSGCALLGTVLAVMAGLIRAEARYTHRALHYRPPHQPASSPRGRAQPAGARYGTYTHAKRPHARTDYSGQRFAQPAPSPPANPWAPFVLEPNSGRDDLKRQYRALARAHHPDRGGDPRDMARINALYAALVDRR
jgi:hypothetical protein